MKIYLASSWRNGRQPQVLAELRAAGHEAYDFRNPAPGNTGFSWKHVHPKPPAEWTPDDYLKAIAHEVAVQGFAYDMNALRQSDATVLMLPCGRSAHLELGFAAGAGKPAYVLLDATIDEPELMYRMCAGIARTATELLTMLDRGCEGRTYSGNPCARPPSVFCTYCSRGWCQECNVSESEMGCLDSDPQECTRCGAAADPESCEPAA